MSIVSKPATKEYLDNFDEIFNGVKGLEKKEEETEDVDVADDEPVVDPAPGYRPR